MAYTVEIELPKSGLWFRYGVDIESSDEAESVMLEAEKKFKARVKIE
ncbi:MAG: hypothetical protein JSV75_06085 [Candidatus Bathyarchaeota archaeon]|nr:MAG: hypothetical protein JSV75_06085 [Candidatus Bathyarchaeota archaeon]